MSSRPKWQTLPDGRLVKIESMSVCRRPVTKRPGIVWRGVTEDGEYTDDYPTVRALRAALVDGSATFHSRRAIGYLDASAER